MLGLRIFLPLGRNSPDTCENGLKRALFTVRVRGDCAGKKAVFGADSRGRAFLPPQNGAAGETWPRTSSPRVGFFSSGKKLSLSSRQLAGYPLREANSAPDTFDNSQSVPNGKTIVEIVK